MSTKLITAPAATPVSLTEVKLDRRLVVTENEAEAYTSEDDLLERLIYTATEEAEAETWRKLITQTWELYLDEWPEKNFIKLPFPPLQSVTGIYYKDENYEEVTDEIEFKNFDEDIISEPGRIVLNSDANWPDVTLYTINPIRILFKCGYGDKGTSVPYMIRAAILLMIGDLYEHREETIIGLSFATRKAIERLLFGHSKKEFV